MNVAVFAGLVFDELDNLVETTYVGDTPHYVIDDAGFLRHVPSEHIDRQILAYMTEQVEQNREEVVVGTLQYLGQEDLFTKAAVESSLNNIEEHINQLLQFGLPEEARAGLGLLGFRVVVNLHGDVINVNMPGGPLLDE